MAPRVSIIIVTWNSEYHLPQCLACVSAQAYTDFEVIVVDNCSTDGTVACIEHFFPQSQVIRNHRNQGFTRASNQGIRASQGEFILCVNPDAFLESDFLQELVSLLSHNPRYGSVGGKVLRYKDGKKSNFIDSTGLFLGRSLRARDRGNMENDHGQYDAPGPVFALCGAAVLFRRQALERIRVGVEYFDEDFFAYYDDLDVGWRLQLAGYDNGYTPAAVAYHVRGGSGLGDKFFRKSPAMQQLTIRNRYWMLVKNLSISNACYFLPFLLATELGIIIYSSFHSPHLWSGYRDVCKYWATMRHKRRLIQSTRVRDSQYIRRWISGSLP